ncbi:MAG: hypothetical protein IIU77_05255, partial [Clostridia bacterium]|nr:hypothetical protein [Clostridia bacterium]
KPDGLHSQGKNGRSKGQTEIPDQRSKKLTKLFQQSRWTTRPSCDMLLPYPIRFDLTEPHLARKGNV